MNIKVKRELYERVLIPAVMYGSQLWVVLSKKRHKMNVFVMK